MDTICKHNHFIKASYTIERLGYSRGLGQHTDGLGSCGANLQACVDGQAAALGPHMRGPDPSGASSGSTPSGHWGEGTHRARGGHKSPWDRKIES